MLIYKSLADYLQSNPCTEDYPTLNGSDRPFLALNSGEKLVKDYPFLIQHQDRIYEIGFPWVQVHEWEERESFSQEQRIETNTGNFLNFVLEDEVLDETQISNDESKVKNLKNDLGDRFERRTADTIAIFISLFDQLLGTEKQRSQVDCFLLSIPEKLDLISQEEARLPLVLSLNRRYELRHKLELITPKLRSQLNRTAEMIPIGRIQEMDAYCLRDYVRRPGQNAIEKAGNRQELMGIKRYQNFNTPENRFLKYFCTLLHLECREYTNLEEAKRLQQAIHRFDQEPSVQAIPKTHHFADKPNYVLQQNPIYRSFYQAFLDYLKRRSEKEKIWGFRQALLVDTVTVLLISALLNLEGSYVLPMDAVKVRNTPVEGQYLDKIGDKSLCKICCFLQTKVIHFEIIKPIFPQLGDLGLKIKVQDFINNSPRSFKLKIWVFWYKPKAQILQSIDEENVIYIYLYDKPKSNQTQVEANQPRIPFFQIPDPIVQDLEVGVLHLTDQLCQWLGRLAT